MKKNLFVSLAVLFALVSCGNNPVPEPEPQPEPEPVVDLLSDIHTLEVQLVNADEADGLIDEIVLLTPLTADIENPVFSVPYTDGRIVIELPESLPDEVLFALVEDASDFEISNPDTKITRAQFMGLKESLDVGEIVAMVGDGEVSLMYANHSTTMTSPDGVRNILKKGWNFVILPPVGSGSYYLTIVSEIPADLIWYFMH